VLRQYDLRHGLLRRALNLLDFDLRNCAFLLQFENHFITK